MKKKIFAVVLGLALCFGMIGCTKGDIEPENSDLGNKYIDLVTIYKDDGHNTEVLYDKNTKVMYFQNGLVINLESHLFIIQMEQLNYMTENRV